MREGCSSLISELQHSMVGGLKVVLEFFDNGFTLPINLVNTLSRVRLHTLFPSKLIRKDIGVLAFDQNIGRHNDIVAQCTLL